MIAAMPTIPTVRRYVGTFTQIGSYIERTGDNFYTYVNADGSRYAMGDVSDVDRDLWLLIKPGWTDITENGD